MIPITHPLQVGTKVRAKRKNCACKGAVEAVVEGTIQKVINNHQGWFYYLSAGVTVKYDAVQQVL